jgi:hypothetical protein
METTNPYSTTAAGNPRKILGSSIKVEKGNAQGVLTAVLYLSPASESGRNLCPWATEGCARACLGHSSGRLSFSTSKQARIAKSRWFLEHRAHFLAQLHEEIDAHVRRARRQGKVPAVRLNGSSDILWERHIDMARWPDCRFYDYTKAPLAKRSLPANYSLTFSYSEAPGSHADALAYLDAGHNVAIVVRDKQQVSTLVEHGFEGFPAIDGDLTDIRFDDPPGHWVALYAKGAARKDTSGFVQDL